MAYGVLRGGYRLEAHSRCAVRRAVHDQVVLRLERAPGYSRMGEEQPVQVKQQAGVERTPVLLEQVVLGVAVAGQLLLAPVAQRGRPPVDDPLGSVRVRDDNTLDRGRRGDALHPGPVSELGEQARHLSRESASEPRPKSIPLSRVTTRAGTRPMSASSRRNSARNLPSNSLNMLIVVCY